MTPDALYLAADIIQTLGRIALALILLGIIAAAALIARAHLAEVRRTLDYVTWGECPRCGKDDCWCDRDGEGWRDLMDAARDEELDFAVWEQEVTR